MSVRVDGAMAQRQSGLIVPAHLAAMPVPAVPDAAKARDDATAYDLDGRRRVVLTADERRTVFRAIEILKRTAGAGVIVGCNQVVARADGKPKCGQLMLIEDKGQPDEGFGCECTRIHFAL